MPVISSKIYYHEKYKTLGKIIRYVDILLDSAYNQF